MVGGVQRKVGSEEVVDALSTCRDTNRPLVAERGSTIEGAELRGEGNCSPALYGFTNCNGADSEGGR